MANAIVGQDYKDCVKKLRENEVVKSLAMSIVSDLWNNKIDSLTKAGITQSDGGDATFNFMMIVNKELDKAGVTNRTHIGAGAEAVLAEFMVEHTRICDELRKILGIPTN